jgi:hypothetical protein
LPGYRKGIMASGWPGRHCHYAQAYAIITIMSHGGHAFSQRMALPLDLVLKTRHHASQPWYFLSRHTPGWYEKMLYSSISYAHVTFWCKPLAAVAHSRYSPVWPQQGLESVMHHFLHTSALRAA